LAPILAAPTIWAAHFFAMYGAQTLICTAASPAARSNHLLPLGIVLTAVAVAGLVAILASRIVSIRQAHQTVERALRPAFWREVPSVLALVALLGVIWVATPAMLLPACASSLA
jgi:hypothetical protein